MNNGILTRFVIAKILEEIKNSSKNFDECLEKYIVKYSITNENKKIIYNITLTTMRKIFIIDQILNYFITKLNKNNFSYYLIISGVTQICFLNFKSYAVINSSCEAAKYLKKNNEINFINAVLRNIDRNINFISKSSWKKPKYPGWFKNNILNLDSKKRKALYNSLLENPSIHLSFKKPDYIKLINKKYLKTSSKTITLKERVSINELPGYKQGYWWVQDYAAGIAVNLFGNIKNKLALDMCAAPGGKLFQLLSLGAKVDAYDISKKRSEILISNAKRLNYKINLFIKNSFTINIKNKYDIILLDPPCTASGTIRRNPEILYRKKIPGINKLLILQKNLLFKAAKLLKTNGLLIYSVCSIFEKEGVNQIQEFLKYNKNFEINAISKKEINNYKGLISKKGFFNSYPYNLDKIGRVDGFFIARMKKIK